jgi:hypothetical protein
VAITLRDSERDALAALARRAREPEATTAARLIRASLIDNGASLDAAVRGRSAPSHSSGDRHADRAADWLPPAKLAAAIDALRERYPHELRHLRDDALSHTATAEQVAALALLREQIDSGRYDDPRMELLFAQELRVFARWLSEQRMDRRPSRPVGR